MTYLSLGNVVAGAYYIYGSPFEIVVASTFLYKSVRSLLV